MNRSQAEALLQAYIHKHIPLTQHLGFERLQYDAGQLHIHCQLAPNRNDKGTAFAGSLSAAATLAGWGLVSLLLKTTLSDPTTPQTSLDAGYDVVIRDSHNEYLKPVTQDFVVRAQLSADSATRAKFIQQLQQRGKARIGAEVVVEQGGELCFRLTGRYVALARPSV